MNRYVIHAVTLTMGLTLGVAVDRAMSGPRGNGMAVRNAGGYLQPATLQASPTSAGNSQDLAAFRAMIREELTLAAARGAAATKATESAGATAPPPAATPQEVQEAAQAVQNIISGGAWSDLQREQFHQRIASLDPAAREQAMQQLVQAIDNGSLKVSTRGPLL